MKGYNILYEATKFDLAEASRHLEDEFFQFANHCRRTDQEEDIFLFFNELPGSDGLRIDPIVEVAASQFMGMRLTRDRKQAQRLDGYLQRMESKQKGGQALIFWEKERGRVLFESIETARRQLKEIISRGEARASARP